MLPLNFHFYYCTIHDNFILINIFDSKYPYKCLNSNDNINYLCCLKKIEYITSFINNNGNINNYYMNKDFLIKNLEKNNSNIKINDIENKLYDLINDILTNENDIQKIYNNTKYYYNYEYDSDLSIISR